MTGKYPKNLIYKQVAIPNYLKKNSNTEEIIRVLKKEKETEVERTINRIDKLRLQLASM